MVLSSLDLGSRTRSRLLALGVSALLGLTGCGGSVRDRDSRGIDDGNNGGGGAGGPNGGKTGGSGASRGGGPQDRDGGSAGEGGSGSSTGGSSSSNDGGGGQGSGATGGTAAGGDGPRMEPAQPPPSVDLLKELEKLRMKDPLSTIVTSRCTTTMSLDWDLDRDGTTEASESRIFDEKGRLAAAEIRGARDGGPAARKRVLLSYDGAGRPKQYLYQVDGDGVLLPWIDKCFEAVPDLPRGTAVDIEYASNGAISVRAVTAETCAREPVCEIVTFDENGRFVGRHRGCEGQTDDPDRIAFARFEQIRKLDDTGRPTLDSLTVPFKAQAFWPSDVTYTHPSAETEVLSWMEDDGPQSSCCGGLLRTLTRTFAASGRPIRAEFDQNRDKLPDEVVTYEYDPDGCGSVESTDSWNDGVPDLITKTSCTNGRVTHQEERNMRSVRDQAEYDKYGYYRIKTPLFVTAQSNAVIDLDYDDRGRLRERRYDFTTVQSIQNVTRSQHEVFSYDDDSHSSATLERMKPASWFTWNSPPAESSRSTCMLEAECAASPSIDPETGRCEMGLGVSVVPEPYTRIPGTAGLDLELRGVPWVPTPVGFIHSLTLLRDFVGY